MNRIQELEDLKAMYIQDLEELAMFEANPQMYELRKHELEFRIMSIEDTIEYLQEQQNSKKTFGIIVTGIVMIILGSIIYLIS